ncbi:portal protein [Oleisolibacter albus]|uniref:portal protein n=1 Tax=Oleisolibacter albus TaxID=2171757 RepID=UPI000DF362E4|nr:portal protein [Oleisolibacter albus]
MDHPAADAGPPFQAPALQARALLDRHAAALARRRPWEALWQDCYAHVLPQHAPFAAGPAERRGDRLYDATAADAADQLAASLLAQLTPPWSRWAGLTPGPALEPGTEARLAPLLEQAGAALQTQIDRSNFAVEAHQAFLDVVIAGTGCLLVEEAPPGAASALRFTAVPLAELVLEEGPEGRLDTVFRRSGLSVAVLRRRFGDRLPTVLEEEGALPVLEAVVPDGTGWRWSVVLEQPEPVLLAEGRFAEPPFVAFRWMKAPGEVYGRGPVMKALPDIRTANKVVELVLKNASIAVTGIWQADDDGVLNPAAIRLVPGTIIPKAVGSAGLTPLASPGRFDVSQLVLEDLRGRIRRALLADRLGPVEGPRMTATEVLERSAEMARLLGATFGRLQSELLVPLVRRCLAILRRRGEVPDLVADGRLVAVQILSPLARAQARRDAETTLRWLESVAALGPEALAAVDLAACARFLADAAGVPAGLVRGAHG